MTAVLLKLMVTAGMLSAAAGGTDKQTSEIMGRLAKAQAAVAQGDHQAALDHLNWCYDNSAQVKSEVFGVRSYVIDVMGMLGASYPPARQALKARRDTTLTKVGTPPKICPEFFDLLAINRALGSEKDNEQLIAQLRSAGLKQFADRPSTGPTPPTISCTDIDRRARTTRDIQDPQPRDEALGTIAMTHNLSLLELDAAMEQEQDLLAEISDLQESLGAAASEREQVKILAEIGWLSSELNESVRPRQECLNQEIRFYTELTAFRSRFGTASSPSTGQ